jgi:hypothetical protein
LISVDSPNPEIAEIAMTLSAIVDGIGPAEYEPFAAAILAASDLGQDTIDGAPAHHFRALVDAEKSAAALDLTCRRPHRPSRQLQRAVRRRCRRTCGWTSWGEW